MRNLPKVDASCNLSSVTAVRDAPDACEDTHYFRSLDVKCAKLEYGGPACLECMLTVSFLVSRSLASRSFTPSSSKENQVFSISEYSFGPETTGSSLTATTWLSKTSAPFGELKCKQQRSGVLSQCRDPESCSNHTPTPASYHQVLLQHYRVPQLHRHLAQRSHRDARCKSTYH